jgi:RsiW-degrading membrane proteinase PrsW (M82 family)
LDNRPVGVIRSSLAALVQTKAHCLASRESARHFLMADEIEVGFPSIQVEQVSETEKLGRRRYQEARAAAIRRGTWITGTWASFLATIGATWFLEDAERGLITAVIILAGALLTGLCGLGYAAKVGFVLSLTARKTSEQMRWMTLVWVMLWGSLVGGVAGLVLSLFLRRERLDLTVLCAAGGYLLGAVLGNRLVHRRYPRNAAK